MKNKILLLLIVSAIGTLSFVKVNTLKQTKPTLTVTKKVINEPVGGFISEDKF